MEATDPSEHRTRPDESQSTAPPLDDPISSCTLAVSTVPTEKRWPAWMVFFTAWLLPATTARRTQHVTLRKAFLIHVAAILLAAMLCALFIAMSLAIDRSLEFKKSIGDLFYSYREIIIGITWIFLQHALEAVAVTGLMILVLETGFLLVAFLLAPWGAVDEKIRSTYANALRQCWIFSAAMIPCLVISGLTFVLFTLGFVNWREQVRPFPVSPPPLSPNATTQQKEDYKVALAEYDMQEREWLQQREISKPWYVKHDEKLAGYAGCVGGAWLLWILLRMIGARRHVPPLLCPPMCEYCGYNLTGARMEGRCPECGEPVILSLGSEARPGTPWQHRREIGFLRAWWRSTSEAILHPRSFGQKIQTRSSDSDHRLFFALHLPVVFLIAVTSISMIEIVDDLTRSGIIKISPYVIWLVAPLTGYCTALIVLVIPLLTSWLVAIYLYFEEKRNLLNVAMQMTCYLTGFLLLWALGVGILSCFLPSLEHDLRNMLYGSCLNRYGALIPFILWLIPNLCCLGWYLRLVLRGTAAARYANR